jgi:hypothetical protein
MPRIRPVTLVSGVGGAMFPLYCSTKCECLGADTATEPDADWTGSARYAVDHATEIRIHLILLCSAACICQ